MSAKYIIKLLTLGDTTVGKSSIVLRFTNNTYNEKIFSTIGIDFQSKYVEYRNTPIKVLLWDTAGQEKFQNIAKGYYNGANGVFLVYDITNRRSFERIDFWMKELKEYNKIEELFIVLVANKVDKINEREVTKEEGEKYAKNNKIDFCEVSAKTGEEIEYLFNKAIKGSIKMLLSKNEQGEIDENLTISFLEKERYIPKRNKCC